MGSRANWTRRALAAGGGMTMAVVGLGVSPASAAPSNAPTAISGVFQCQSGLSGSFVVNTGKSNAVTWNDAHLTFTNGGHGLFSPNAVDLTVFDPSHHVVNVEQATKPNTTPGPQTCQISAPLGGGFTLSGTVAGKIVMTG